VSCSICMDRFNSSKHTPRTLRCNHTFCEWCIRGLGEKQKVTCPKCRQETPVENADVTKLLCNFQLLEAVEAAGAEAAAETDPVCEVCDDEHAATHRCVECEELCAPLLSKHRKSKASRNHVLPNCRRFQSPGLCRSGRRGGARRA
jgi:hypothetical protein